MDSSVNLLTPYSQSHTHDELEEAMQSVFITAFHELYGEAIRDIHHFGMPHLGSPKVVERFSKQDGLVVLRRPNSSDEIMRVIYANWRSLASKRGLAFLEFVLQMLWADQWEVKRLYHSIDLIDRYPTVTTVEPVDNSFLTSRILISLDSDVDFSEASHLAPTLFRLVPANIVAQISSKFETEDIDPVGVASVYMPFMTANFCLFDDEYKVGLPEWSEWMILKNIQVLSNGRVVYKGFKSNMAQMYESIANRDLTPFILSQLNVEAYRQMDGVNDANKVLTLGCVGYKWDLPNDRIIANRVPEIVNLQDVSDVLLQRFYEGGFFVGYEAFYGAIENVAWVLDGIEIYEFDTSTQFTYTAGTFVSLVSFIDALNLYITDKIDNNPDWAGAVLGEVTIEYEDALTIIYIQHYTIEDVAHEERVRVDKDINQDYDRDDPANRILVDSAKRLTLFDRLKVIATDFDDQLLFAMIQDGTNKAYSESSNAIADHLYLANLEYYNFQQIADQIVLNLSSDNAEYKLSAENYVKKIASTVFNPDPANQLIKYADLVVLFEASKVLVT